MARCEDYPCCEHGHLPGGRDDGLGCDYVPPSRDVLLRDPHLTCDHEAGVCEFEPEDDDDEDLITADDEA